MTLSGIEPATFRFVAQYLNHRATAVLRFLASSSYMYKIVNFPRKELYMLYFKRNAT